jgi:hypothetical protein
MADPDEAAGQDVEQKPAEEGGGIERGEPGGVAMGAVPPAEGDLAVPQRDEPIVGEGDAIGIATEVGQDLLSPSEGGLAIHDPRLPRRPREWAPGVPVRSPNLLVVEGVLEQAQQLAAEDLGKDTHRQEEVAAGGDPAGVVDGEAPAGDDAVDMRMVEELLGPGVQDGGEADLRAEAPAGDRVECLGRGGEQQAVRHRRRGEEERVQLGRHGEDDVEVLYGEQIALLGLNSARFVQPLAFGAVPIAAGVVGELFLPAGLALPAVAAERGRAALGDRLEDAPLLRGQAVEILRMRTHDIGQFPAAGASQLAAHGRRSLSAWRGAGGADPAGDPAGSGSPGDACQRPAYRAAWCAGCGGPGAPGSRAGWCRFRADG